MGCSLIAATQFCVRPQVHWPVRLNSGGESVANQKKSGQLTASNTRSPSEPSLLRYTFPAGNDSSQSKCVVVTRRWPRDGRAKMRTSLGYARDYFFIPRTASFAALATRNLTTVLAGILIFCCVFGLKPVRAFLFCFTSLPKPGNDEFAALFSLFVCEVAERLE